MELEWAKLDEGDDRGLYVCTNGEGEPPIYITKDQLGFKAYQPTGVEMYPLVWCFCKTVAGVKLEVESLVVKRVRDRATFLVGKRMGLLGDWHRTGVGTIKCYFKSELCFTAVRWLEGNYRLSIIYPRGRWKRILEAPLLDVLKLADRRIREQQPLGALAEKLK